MIAPTKTQKTTRSDRLLETLSDYDNILILTHNNPDPDAISSGWAIYELIRRKLGITPRFLAGGDVVRSENRELLKRFDPPLELVDGLDVEGEHAVVLVDCGLNVANHLPLTLEARPVAVLDHHHSASRPHLSHVDLRSRVAATASIAASYLREQDVEPSSQLASALLYAVRSETRGFETYHSPLDRSIVRWLTQFGSPQQIAEIESAPLQREWFADLALAMQCTLTYDDIAFCMLPRANGPEIVGEVADLLIRCEGIDRVLCAAAWEDKVLLSCRTEHTGDDAAELLRSTLEGLGHAGGHEHRAGGQILGLSMDHIPQSLEDELRSRWLSACGSTRERGTRLIGLSESLECLA